MKEKKKRREMKKRKKKINQLITVSFEERDGAAHSGLSGGYPWSSESSA